jgi:multiple sugar transport system ATP-binding protein
MTMGDRVAVLRFGKLQQFASPNELYDRPANAFVAGFIGSPAMNLLTAPVVADGVRISEDSTLPLEREHLTKLHEAGVDKVTLGIRPEDLEVSPGGGIDVVIDLVEDLGSETYLYTHAHPDVELVARSLSRNPVKLADTVELRMKPEGNVHLFHPETGERLN